MNGAHVLIARTDNIGDVVLTLPLAGYLKKRFPGIRIGFICRSYAAPLVQLCRAVDYVVSSDALDDPAAWLAASGADTIIFAKPHKALAKAAKKARIPQRVGTSHKWFHWFTCNKLAHFSRVKSPLHEAQLNFELLKPLGINHIPELQDIPALYRLDASSVPNPVALDAGRFHLVLHPKSNGNGREWPIGHFTELARLLEPREDIRLWITGSGNEHSWLEANAPALLAQPNVTSVCGRFPLDGLAAFICAADGLIASGTGPLHLSAALGQNTLGLFPPVKPIHPGRWAPLGKRAQFLCKPVPCARCADPAQCTCMVGLAPEEVMDVVMQWKAARMAVPSSDQQPNRLPHSS